MQRYFIAEKYSEGNLPPLTGEVYHHIAHVMRLTEGKQIYAVFSDQVSILAEITDISDAEIYIRELSKEKMDKELPVQVTIAGGYPKGDKLEWIIQKGTELGAHSFIGFPALASVVKWDKKKLEKKHQRFEKIAREAAEQSHRQWCPKIQLFADQRKLLAVMKDYDVILIAYEEAAKENERANLAKALENVKPGERLLAVFGPEGGLAPEEVRQFQENGGILCGLGPRILRTETAPLYLLSAVSYALELACFTNGLIEKG